MTLADADALAPDFSMPYCRLDADMATFGLMGSDLLRHGYVPTLAYGQHYLFSITPHLMRCCVGCVSRFPPSWR